MFGKRHTKKFLVTAAVSGALVLGMGSSAVAALDGASGAEATPFTHQIVTMDASGQEASDAEGAAHLTQASSRSMPEYTVAQADALAKDKVALEKQLEESETVDAERYLKALNTDVSWNTCIASTYGIGDGLLGSACADGSTVTSQSMGVAHKTLALGTKIQIMYNGKVVNAVVRDRGPYIDGRELDLQPAVARALGFGGLGEVKYRIIE